MHADRDDHTDTFKTNKFLSRGAHNILSSAINNDVNTLASRQTCFKYQAEILHLKYCMFKGRVYHEELRLVIFKIRFNFFAL